MRGTTHLDSECGSLLPLMSVRPGSLLPGWREEPSQQAAASRSGSKLPHSAAVFSLSGAVA